MDLTYFSLQFLVNMWVKMDNSRKQKKIDWSIIAIEEKQDRWKLKQKKGCWWEKMSYGWWECEIKIMS